MLRRQDVELILESRLSVIRNCLYREAIYCYLCICNPCTTIYDICKGAVLAALFMLVIIISPILIFGYAVAKVVSFLNQMRLALCTDENADKPLPPIKVEPLIGEIELEEAASAPVEVSLTLVEESV